MFNATSKTTGTKTIPPTPKTIQNNNDEIQSAVVSSFCSKSEFEDVDVEELLDVEFVGLCEGAIVGKFDGVNDGVSVGVEVGLAVGVATQFDCW